jgi:hypothetical protein
MSLSYVIDAECNFTPVMIIVLPTLLMTAGLAVSYLLMLVFGLPFVFC